MIFILIISFIILIYVLLKIRDHQLLNSVTSKKRGTKSERKLILKLLKLGYSPDQIYHDLYLLKRNGYFSQIDTVLLTETAIIVFEVKEFSGWLFGTGYKPRWTQVLNYGKTKNYFQNPFFQNNNHIETLISSHPELNHIPILNVCVFFGDCEFKDINYIPQDSYLIKDHSLKQLLKDINYNYRNYNPIYYSNSIIQILKNGVRNGSDERIIHNHSNQINNNLGKNRIYH